MITMLPVVEAAVPAGDSAGHTLAAIAHELGEHACAILRQDADSLVFRVPPASFSQRLFPWTREVYRVHCVGASAFLSPKRQYYDIAHGSREDVMREVHRLLKG